MLTFSQKQNPKKGASKRDVKSGSSGSVPASHRWYVVHGCSEVPVPCNGGGVACVCYTRCLLVVQSLLSIARRIPADLTRTLCIYLCTCLLPILGIPCYDEHGECSVGLRRMLT